MTERNRNTNRRGTDRARAITAMKKRRAARNRKIVITSVAATLAIALIAGVSVLGFHLVNNNSAPATTPTTVTKLAMTDPTTQTGSATQAPTENNNTAVSDNNTGSNNTDNQQAQPAENQGSEDKGYSGGVSSDGIIYDQRHEVPEGTGTPLHVYETGKKSGGNYDWDYDTDNGNISICCNYNTTNNQYDFIIYGKAEGTAHISLYYAASDTTMVPVPVTVNVDANLNVTQG